MICHRAACGVLLDYSSCEAAPLKAPVKNKDLKTLRKFKLFLGILSFTSYSLRSSLSTTNTPFLPASPCSSVTMRPSAACAQADRSWHRDCWTRRWKQSEFTPDTSGRRDASAPIGREGDGGGARRKEGREEEEEQQQKKWNKFRGRLTDVSIHLSPRAACGIKKKRKKNQKRAPYEWSLLGAEAASKQLATVDFLRRSINWARPKQAVYVPLTSEWCMACRGLAHPPQPPPPPPRLDAWAVSSWLLFSVLICCIHALAMQKMQRRQMLPFLLGGGGRVGT